MTQEEKNLLKIDLCCRLPYNIKVHAKYTELGETVELDGIVKMIDTDGFVGIQVMYDISSSFICVDIDNVKPYLFPLSSMTEEQYDEMEKIVSEDYMENIQITKEMREKVDFITHWPLYSPKVIDWFNKNHFDYRGLIKKGLAIDCTNLNIY